jgi:type III restriction enzyme
VIEQSEVERYDVVNNKLLESIDAAILEDPNPMNTLACLLLDNISEFDGEDADYILDIVGQYLALIGGNEKQQRQIVRRYAAIILADISEQIQKAIKTTTSVVYKVQKDLVVFGKQVKVVKQDGVVDFHTAIDAKKDIKKYSFNGYKKSYYPECGFDSDTERLFSVILEDDKSVIRWIKPPLNQMNIFYRPGTQYNPDFLVETATDKYMVEVKAENEKKNPEVLLKKEEGERWCKYATMCDADGKTWHYRLITDAHITTGNSFQYTIGLSEDIKD